MAKDRKEERTEVQKKRSRILELRNAIAARGGNDLDLQEFIRLVDDELVELTAFRSEEKAAARAQGAIDRAAKRAQKAEHPKAQTPQNGLTVATPPADGE